MPTIKPARCPWPTKPLDIEYHDTEWGVPLHDDRALFELLTLEGAQAGLSWSIVLAKRTHYREAFAGFDPAKVASFSEKRITQLLGNPGLVRHRLKLQATVSNARAVLAVQAECGSLDRYLWGFVDGTPVVNRRRRMQDVPTRTELSDALSRDLQAHGFKFVGTTICYAFMQAAGMVNDHLISCPRHRICASLR